MIDFEWYRSFISVYQQRSVSGAARTRYLTQPAISQHIAALEAEIGESLFIRAPRSMIATDAGKALYSRIVPLIESLEGISLEVKYNASQEKGKTLIKFGGPIEYTSKRILPTLPMEDAQYITQFDLADKLIEQLSAHTLDFAIATKRIQEANIQYIPLETEEFVVVAPNHYELPHDVDFLTWLDMQSWISFGLELPIIRRYYLTQFGKRPEFKPNLILPNIGAILAAIEAGHGISVLPTYFIEESLSLNKVKILNPEMIATNVIYFAHRIENKNDPLIKNILTTLKESSK